MMREFGSANRIFDNKIVSNCTTHVYGRMNASDDRRDPRSYGGEGRCCRRYRQALRGRVLFFDRGLAASVQSAYAVMSELASPNPPTAEEVIQKARSRPTHYIHSRMRGVTM